MCGNWALRKLDVHFEISKQNHTIE
jgi:hypothetical protein